MGSVLYPMEKLNVIYINFVFIMIHVCIVILFLKINEKALKIKKLLNLKLKKKKEDKVKKIKAEKAFKKRYNNQQIYKRLLNEAQKKKKQKAAYLEKLKKIKEERKKQVNVKLVKDFKEAKKSHPYFLNI